MVPDQRCTAARCTASGTWLQEPDGIPMLRRKPAARRQTVMTIFGKSTLGTIIAAILVGGLGAQRATALTPAGELASHRAV